MVFSDRLARSMEWTNGICRYGNRVDCCWGWTRASWGQCKPVCELGCKHGECVGPDQCRCHHGYTGKTCNQDVNECGLKPRPCKHRCMNTVGSYKCYCLNGYMMMADGTCRNAHTCAMANCQYGCAVMKGEVMCQCPSPGLRLGPDRRTCVDIDECVTREARCPRFRKCVNTFGSYICKCHKGFELRYVNGKYQCTDKNEHDICHDKLNSKKCRCKAGTYGKNCRPLITVTIEPARPATTAKSTTKITTRTTTTTTSPPTTTTKRPTTTTTTPTTTPLTTTTKRPTTTTTTPTTTTIPPTTTTTKRPTTTTTTPTTTTIPPTTTTTKRPTTTTTTTTTTPITITNPPTTTKRPTTTPTTTTTTIATTTTTTVMPTTPTTPPTTVPTTIATTRNPSTVAMTTIPTTAATTTIPTTVATTTIPTTVPSTIPTTFTTTIPTTAASATTIPTTPTEPTTNAPTTPVPTTTTTTTTTTSPAVSPTQPAPSTGPLVTTTLDNHIQKEITQRPRGDVHIPKNPGENSVFDLDFDIELGNTAEYARDDPGAQSLSCSFDQGVCRWMTDEEGDVHWETVSDPAGGRYLTIPEATTRRSVRGARLTIPLALPTTPPWQGGDLCLSFRHRLHGHHIGTLQLFARKGRSHSPAIWTRTGGQGWRYTQITLWGRGLESVVLKGERRRGRSGEIAVDDFSLRRGACSDASRK
ncbi:hypothetical protein NFI96_031513 [Prochilodus magdalenae]|nr:hypothetical protein NFI96_031513 [Prochilodus magdalenae]